MDIIWEPTDPSTICPSDTNVTACAAYGHLYLYLLKVLFGGPITNTTSSEHKCYKMDEPSDRDILRIMPRRYSESRKPQFDFIVIGAGAAGSIVANRLTANPDWNVLLLEAGNEQPEVTLAPAFCNSLLGSNADWKYTTEPNGKSCLARDGRCDWPRGRVMGGTTAVNSLTYIRGNKVDYDGWADLGNPGWSYDEVLPYFKKSEKNLDEDGIDDDYHGFDGEQSVQRYPYIDKPADMVTEAFNEIGLPYVDCNGPTQLGTMQAQAFVNNGVRDSAYTAFIKPIRNKRKNLTIRTNSEVVKILIDKNKKAYGVQYKHNDTLCTEFVSKEIIVSGGTINSPKLLMLSGIGPKEHLESLNIPVIKDSAVGQNLQDHVAFNGLLIRLSNETATSVSKEEMLLQLYKYKFDKDTDGPLSANGPTNSLAFLKSTPDLEAPDMQFQGVPATFGREFLNEPVLSDKLAYFETSFYDHLIPRPMNIATKSRGYIYLNKTDPNGPPLIYANYFDDESDLDTVVAAAKVWISLEDTDALKSRGAHYVRETFPACKEYEWGTDEYLICSARAYTGTCYHPAGTCKMGPESDENAVVDSELRVHGIHGLRVIDASIMPVLIRGNTCAPTMMIAEKGVEYIIKQHSK